MGLDTLSIPYRNPIDLLSLNQSQNHSLNQRGVRAKKRAPRPQGKFGLKAQLFQKAGSSPQPSSASLLGFLKSTSEFWRGCSPTTTPQTVETREL